jgi:hypothetical protein
MLRFGSYRDAEDQRTHAGTQEQVYDRHRHSKFQQAQRVATRPGFYVDIEGRTGYLVGLAIEQILSERKVHTGLSAASQLLLLAFSRFVVTAAAAASGCARQSIGTPLSALRRTACHQAREQPFQAVQTMVRDLPKPATQNTHHL